MVTEEEESIKDDNTDQEQLQESTMCGLERNEVESTESPRSDDTGRVIKSKGDERKMRTLSGRIFNWQGKNLRMNIPLTTPTRTISAITDLVREDLVNQSKKFGPEGGKLHINKTKLHHAEKMIKGAFIELYKGLGYLKTYR